MIYRHMKKILASASSASLFLASAIPAYAAEINLCPLGSQFDPLCKSLGAGSFATIISAIIIIMLIAAVVLALFFLIWGGIKWILSGGDKTAVEGARNHIVAAIVGLIIAFLAFFILIIIGGVFKIDILKLALPTALIP